jgi:hypothetical protein
MGCLGKKGCFNCINYQSCEGCELKSECPFYKEADGCCLIFGSIILDNVEDVDVDFCWCATLEELEAKDD